ncbi:hypothetical protein, partial [Vibrio crassostreae]|uniref:hypothetical protein n=1 Tax=Vibrio crassostreae TaxID=246167 RepID=UPI001B3020E2
GNTQTQKHQTNRSALHYPPPPNFKSAYQGAFFVLNHKIKRQNKKIKTAFRQGFSSRKTPINR